MPHISYVDPATVDDPELQAMMERARAYGTPRPESQAIRVHHPEVMKAFNNAWEVFFRQGVTDHAIKELTDAMCEEFEGDVDVGPVVEVDTTETVDVICLAQQVRRLFG